MLSGVGQLGIITLDQDEKTLAENIFFPGYFYNFNYNIESDQKEAKAWVAGKRKTVASAIGDETYTLELSFQYLDWQHLGFAYDEMISTSSNVTLPIMKSAVVAAGIITDNDIVAGNEASVKVYVGERGVWGEAGFFTKNATPVSRQFDADGTAHTITFDAEMNGTSVTYMIEKTYTSIESIGYESTADDWGSLSFIGKGYGPAFPNGILIYLPNITRKSSPSLQTDDVPEFSIEFSANVPSGKNVPHQFFNLATAT